MTEISNDADSHAETEEENCFKICDLCNKLCDQIPQKCMKNFRAENVRLTCMDASEHLIVFGSNVGTVFIFNRMLSKFSQIKGQDENTCVKLSGSLFYDQVAIGLSNGFVLALQLPSPKPGYSKKLIERSLRDTHKCRITCMEWSANGGKLFSGDSSGLVMMTLLDFENDVFYSTFVCCEESPVVQLSFCANFLAVSTLQRTVLVDIPQDCAVKQLLSSVDRKTFGYFGIVFEPYLEGKLHDCSGFYAYSAETGCILHKNDDKANIVESIDCNSSLNSAQELPIPADLKASTSTTVSHNCELGILKLFNASLLIAVNESDLLILDVKNTKNVKLKCRLFGKIRDFCCTKLGELFVLCGDRTILRFSSFHDENLIDISTSFATSANESSLLNGSRMLLKKITDLHNLSEKSAKDAAPSGECNNAGVDLKTFFGKIRRQEEVNLCAHASGSGMSTPEAFYEQDDDILSLNDEKQETWILSNENVAPVDKVVPDNSNNASSYVGNEKPTVPKKLSLESYSGVLSSLIETVGGFGVQSETGQLLPANYEEHIHVHGEIRKNNNENSSVSVFHKFTKKKQPKVQSTPPSLHPVEKLATPTEEEFSKNRFNPFMSCAENQPIAIDEENLGQSESCAFTVPIDSPLLTPMNRETLEQLLDSTLMPPNVDDDDDLINRKIEENEPANQNLLSIDPPQPSATSGLSSPDTSDSLVHVDSNRDRSSSDFSTALRLQLDLQAADTSSNDSRVTSSNVDDLLTVDSDETSVSSLSSPPVELQQDADIWSDTLHQNPLCSVSGSSTYVCCADAQKNFKYTLLGLTSFLWQISEEKADQVGVSPKGTIVWRLHNGTAYVLLKPHKKAPKGLKWLEAAPNVSAISVCDHTVWYIRLNGELLAQTDLRPDRPCYKAKRIDCPWKLVYLACSNECLWALVDDGRILVRTGMTTANRLGDDWVDFLPIGPGKIVSFSLFAEAAWLLDENRQLWFCTGLSAKNPLGTCELWQVSLPNSLNAQMASHKKVKLYSVFSLPTGLWLTYWKSLWHCRGSLTGHHWSRSIPIDLDSVAHFRRLCVANVFDEAADYVWLQRANMNHEIMAFQFKSKMLHSIPPCSENEPVALSSTIGVVWVLDSKGQIFIRHNVNSADFPFGTDWQCLDMSQLTGTADCVMNHLCCSMDSVWACTTGGRVFVRIGTSVVNTSGLTPAWVILDHQNHCPVRRIFCSSDGNFVWALSDNYKILVRLGITREIPIGTSWTVVDDLKARHLAVGFKSVWALTPDHQVYYRYGIEDANPCGNYWKLLPGHMRALSTTPNNHLWAIDMDNRLVKHKIRIHHFSDKQVVADAPKELTEDYEVV